MSVEINNTPQFGRVITAMVTPFDSNGNLDLAEAARLAEHLVNNGSDGLVVAGTTGESATLTSVEKISLFKAVREAVGVDVKILAGTGSYDTRETIELSRESEQAGVDGFLVVTPYYNKPSQEGLYQHYKAVAEAVSLPVMLYNVPARTGVNLEAETVIRLSSISNIVAVKEAGKNLEQISEIKMGVPSGFLIYSGDDALTLPILAIGGVGVISVTSHVIGKDLQKMIAAFFHGDLAMAQCLHGKGIPITKAVFCVPNPVGPKTALAHLGILPNATVRLPLVNAPERERSLIISALKEYGLQA